MQCFYNYSLFHIPECIVADNLSDTCSTELSVFVGNTYGLTVSVGVLEMGS